MSAAFTAGCAFPSDPAYPPLALRRSGGEYFIRLAGTCTYPDQTSVLVRVSDTGRTLWRARLKAGSPVKEIEIGDTATTLQTAVPFTGLPQGQRITIGVDFPKGGWENEFLLPIAEGQFNGGRLFGDRSADLPSLSKSVDC